MISADQCRGACAMLRWSTIELSRAAQVGQATVNRFERTEGETIPATIAAMQRALEAAGVEFLDGNGVRLKAKAAAPSGGRPPGPGSAQKPASPAKTTTPRAKKPTASDRQAT